MHHVSAKINGGGALGGRTTLYQSECTPTRTNTDDRMATVRTMAMDSRSILVLLIKKRPVLSKHIRMDRLKPSFFIQKYTPDTVSHIFLYTAAGLAVIGAPLLITQMVMDSDKEADEKKRSTAHTLGIVGQVFVVLSLLVLLGCGLLFFRQHCPVQQLPQAARQPINRVQAFSSIQDAVP